jgi:membrane protease subunit HflK
VLLDTKGDGSNLVYLPIDKLLEQGRRVQRAEPEATVTIEGTTTTAPDVSSDRRSRGTR